MGRIVGIDLGTTYSVVTIPEERSGDGFLVLRGCPGYSVILDRSKSRITPSVVAEDSTGNIVVGHTAKGRAGFSPEPIMFAKRFMGEDTTFQLAKQGTLRPEEVAAHVLRYLKGMAEQRLGELVDEAVITVPAYFSLRAKQLTEQAGMMADLKVRQIAQEPVAAALMYCVGDRRDNLRIMTYDLGGGTFDVAILDKRDGVISTDSIRAFDGDRRLGGYDFDKSLALWLLHQLNARGYDLDPDDNVTFAKLMVYAERAKIELSRSESYQFQEPTTGITDQAGKPVILDNLEVTRDDFEAMISTQVDYTIQLCRRAMTEKAARPIRPDEIDEIIMVGGSSRIPLVARRLEEAFGRTPQLVEPDLCVALGAAILAGTKGKTFGCLQLDTIPSETDLPSLTVTGRLVPGNDLRAVEGCVVTLRATDGAWRNSRTTGAEGAFVFDAVPLVPEDTRDFALVVTSPGGVEVAGHRFSVVQTSAAIVGGLVEQISTNVLSKPIGILLVDGFHVIAPERTPLPYETVVHTKTMDASGAIRVPILEEHNPLGEIVMRDIPTTLTVGSAVEVKLTIQENYQIRGRAYVRALSREATVDIQIPERSQKSVEALQHDYELLAARADDALASAGRGAMFGDAKAKRLKDRMQACEQMLKPGERPEPAKVQDCLDEIESLVRNLEAGWRPEPPRAVFEHKAREAEGLLATAIKQKPEVAKDGYDKHLAALRAEAEKAYTDQNPAVWKESYTKVAHLCDQLEALGRPDDGGGDGQPDPGKLLIELAKELDALAERARNVGRYAEFEDEFKDLAAALKRINPDAPDAMRQMADWYLTKFSDLQHRLGAPQRRGILGLDLVQKGRGNV
jgi:actin-like ATPase involved in cell morphogenesis